MANGADESRHDGVRPTIFLVRHGRTAWNAQRRFLGRTDLPLDETGEQQAAALGAQWSSPVGALWSSPLLRARATARRLGEARVDPRWTEVAHGELEGLEVEEARVRFPQFFEAWARDPGSTRIPGGETLEEARARALSALADLPVHSGAVIVAHQLVLAALVCGLADVPLRDWRRFTLEPCGIRRLLRSGDRWTVAQDPA